MISIQNLSLSYGSGNKAVRPLNGVSLKIAQGEVFGIVGESGCGKSSLLRCISGLEKQWSGKISVAGRDMRQRRATKDFHLVQMVFQDPYGTLHPRHTIATALSEPLRAQGADRSDAVIADALQMVGLEPDFRFRYPHQLSGGQRQRVAIARALILEPQVILLDEPTSALDVSVQAEILNLLSDLQQAKGLTYILVSHDLAVVAHLCDRLVVMHQGDIVEELSPAALRENRAQHPYSQELLASSRHFSRETNVADVPM
jgi:peptide/nickel transport system ATP-binding protein